MKQFYAKYTEWEDFINGMYEIPNKKDFDTYVNNSIIMLSDCNMFLNTCKLILLNWNISSMVNLTNKSCNRRAWLGQSACSYVYKSPEICTRIAWSRLTEDERLNANNVADSIINNFEIFYESKNIKLH